MTQFLAVRLSITVLSLLLAPMPWLFMAMYLMFIVLQQLMSTTQLTAVMLLRFTAVSLMMVVLQTQSQVAWSCKRSALPHHCQASCAAGSTIDLEDPVWLRPTDQFVHAVDSARAQLGQEVRLQAGLVNLAFTTPGR